jgi:hypothetical protein
MRKYCRIYLRDLDGICSRASSLPLSQIGPATQTLMTRAESLAILLVSQFNPFRQSLYLPWK